MATGDGSASLLRWLLLQNGGPAASSVPWPEIVRAASGKQVTAVNPGNPADATALAKLGATLDTILPRLNRPDAPWRTALTLTAAEINARVADELRAALGSPAESVSLANVSCPILRWDDPAGGRVYHLVVASRFTGSKDAARELTVHAADVAGRITADGACLLVGIELDGKPGHNVALLNWELVDLARVSLRSAVTFEDDPGSLHAPGAPLGDGRRGRD